MFTQLEIDALEVVWDTNNNNKPTKCNLVYQAIPKKLVKVNKLQTTFKGAEGTKIYSVRRKAIPDIYNSLSEKRRPYAGVGCVCAFFVYITVNGSSNAW